MLRTRAGYCGGTTPSPNYRNLGDHTEAVSIDFDPTVTSYEDLLDRFWNAHHCGSGGSMRQYLIAVFYHNDGQKKVAEKSRARHAAKQGVAPADVKTPILPVNTFTYAEAYHQKYMLRRGSELRQFLETTYPTAKQLADSTVATRLNAFLGWGLERKLGVLEREIANFGLPEKLRKEILAKARRR